MLPADPGAAATQGPGPRDFPLFLAARVAGPLALQIQLVAVSWHVYALTRSPLALGYVGLAQFLPSVCLVLLTGQVADRFDRRRVLAACYVAMALCAALLAWMAARPGVDPRAFYAVMTLVGVARAFAGPASQALLPSLVAPEALPRAIATSTSAWQLATIVGPALGGFLYGASPSAGLVYAASAGLFLLAALFLSLIQARLLHLEQRAVSWGTAVAGLVYVFENRTLLGAISLDLFAVLLGGAVALLPAVASDVLHAGPGALGALRSAPSVGALLVSVGLSIRPIQRHAGAVMLACVFAFGLATVGFGLSRSLPLSMLMLALVGATDMVSVAVRQTLVQLQTPPEMRGRVSAVNAVFIGASNELGEFESGATAAWLGVTPAIVAGGVGTCLVVLAWSLLFPGLRRYEPGAR